MENRVERRKQWAESRQAKARASFAGAEEAVEGIPYGQPILIGHHSEGRHRAALRRQDSRMRAGCESLDMAKHHASKAEGIQTQLDRSIYSDDTNATEALRARIAEREAEHGRLRAYNASCKKAVKEGRKLGNSDLLDESQKADILNLARVCPYQMRPGGGFPGYALSNLRANINRDKNRLESIERKAGG